MWLIEIGIFFVVVSACLYHRLHRWITIFLMGAFLVFLTKHRLFIPWVLWGAWLIFLPVTFFLLIAHFRYEWVTKKAFVFLKTKLPRMSETERIALEAGETWIEKDLFQGKLRWSSLLREPVSVLSPAESAFIANEVETLCGLLKDWQIYREADLPGEVWDYIRQNKFFGLIIPPEYGGLGFSALAHSAIVAKVASRSVSAAVTVMVPNSLGPSELLMHYGTTEQKNKFLPRLARGEEIPCFALTGEESGSDAATMQDIGIICRGRYEDKECIGIRVSWKKRYITLAPVATLIGVAFRLYDPDQLLSLNRDVGITLALIPRDTPGVSVGRRHVPLDMGFMNGPTEGKDVFIPMDLVIGGSAMLGQGWRMLMECLSVGRSISLPALSAAASQMSVRMSAIYAELRVQFKLPIGEFEGIQEVLAQMTGYTYMIEAMRLLTAHAVTVGRKPSIVSAIIKLHATEKARRVVEGAMDIHAGRGIQFGPRNYLGLIYQAMPICITVEGANILTRNLIIFGQGAMRCHPYLFKELEVLYKSEDERKTIREFDRLLLSHIGYFLSLLCRSLFQGLTGGKCLFLFERRWFVSYRRQITRMSTALALVSDMALLLLGGKLKVRERLSARLGDILSHLYIAVAVLKLHKTLPSSQENDDACEWCLQHCLQTIQETFSDLLSNFPKRWIGFLLWHIIFPWGRSYQRPADYLERQVAQSVQYSDAFREQLTSLCYVGKHEEDVSGRMECAGTLLSQCRRALKSLSTVPTVNEIGMPISLMDRIEIAGKNELLADADLHLLREFARVRYDAIRVDDFELHEKIK